MKGLILATLFSSGLQASEASFAPELSEAVREVVLTAFAVEFACEDMQVDRAKYFDYYLTEVYGPGDHSNGTTFYDPEKDQMGMPEHERLLVQAAAEKLEQSVADVCSFGRSEIEENTDVGKLLVELKH